MTGVHRGTAVNIGTQPEPADASEGAVVTGPDGVARCPWAMGSRLLTDYHDAEWGLPVRGEQPLYERLVLKGFQAGLSCRTILTKRPAFRTAFGGFDPDIVAALGDADIEELMGNPAIIRNRAKIEAARTNARAVLALRDQGGLDHLIWSHRPDSAPVSQVASDIPTRSPESVALANALQRHGFRFIGPTTAHALMETTGMIDTHLFRCHRRGVAPFTTGVGPDDLDRSITMLRRAASSAILGR